MTSGLEEADDRFSQCIAMRMVATADSGLDAGLGQPVRVAL
jgi:hypothetical protein